MTAATAAVQDPAAKKSRAKKTVIVAKGHELSHAEALGLYGMLADVQFSVVEHDGKLHMRRWWAHLRYGGIITPSGASPAPAWSMHDPWCAGSHRSGSSHPGAKSMLLHELVESPRCGGCREDLSADPHLLTAAGGDPDGVKAAIVLLNLREEIARASDLPSKISPSALNTRQHRISAARSWMEREITEALSAPAIHTSWASTLTRARGVLEGEMDACARHIAAAFQSEGTADAILAKIREELYGAGDEITIDETPTLVGLPAQCYIRGRIADALIARYRLECKQGQVLLVPRYIADWVLCSLHQGGPRAQTTAAPGDEEQARLAAMMWDPQASGPMRSLRDMVTAAGEVLAP